MGASVSNAKQVAANIRAHDKVARSYERLHGEIYNPVEQERLGKILSVAIESIGTGGEPLVALDFGCGAGNLTAHLSALGCDVVAADVSTGCLDLVMSKRFPTEIRPMKLNGSDLGDVPDESVDMVATYSVLHHVPDYLGILSEFVRVLKPGGVIFIDHEASHELWNPTPARLAFLEELKLSKGKDWGKYLRPSSYVNWLILKYINPRHRPEGDIHVFPDDHIEWGRISDRLTGLGAKIVKTESYLLFRRGYDAGIYGRYEGLTHDTQYLIARKEKSI